MTARPNQKLPKFVAFMGVFRTFTCGGWTYVTSTDDHDWHDIFMISYLVATLPWTVGCLRLTPPNAKATKYRKVLASTFFGALIPLIYFFIQHKVHRVAGGMLAVLNFMTQLRLFACDTDTLQLTPLTPSSSGPWFCWMWLSMQLLPSSLAPSSSLSEMSRALTRGMCIGSLNRMESTVFQAPLFERVLKCYV